MKKVILFLGLLLIFVFSSCGGDEIWERDPWEFDLWVRILERRQWYEGRYMIRYEVWNDKDFYVNEYTIEFKITEYDGEISYVENKGYDLAYGEVDEYTIYTQVKPAPCSEEEWNESSGKYFAQAQVSNVIIHR